MEDFQEKQIFYTLKEYQLNYNFLLKDYLNQHEDFDELMFIDIELEFYNLCYDNSNIIIGDFGDGPEYCVNGGHCKLLLSKIYDALVNFLDIYDGFDLELSIKYKATFSKIIKFLEDKKKDATTQTNKTFPIFDKVIFTTNTYNPNLTNDPLFNPANEYLILKEKFIEEYQSRTVQYPDFDYLFLVDDDINLKEWEKTQKEKINIAFLKLIKDLNNNKIFFFGCSFDNYKSNYTKRLNQFLNNYNDTSVEDFIISEISFLENLIFDFENGTGGMDEFSMSDVDIFKKASYVVSMISYEQYCYSNNKKINFLKERKKQVINSNSKTYSSFLNNNIFPKSKNEFIQKITEAEKLAKDTIGISIEQDLFTIEQQKINKEHHKEILNKYYTNIINSYNSVVNLYKASNNQFHFLKEFNNHLTDADRIDFIATVLFGYLTDINDENNNYEVDVVKDIFSQLKNISTLIYETKLLELKALSIKKSINDAKNKLEVDEVKSIDNKDVIVDKLENDHLKSTIEDYLEEFEDDINGDGYEKLVDALYHYFKNNEFPVLKNKINFKRINKKRVGWALKELYKSEKTDNLDIVYFRFANENINLFAKEVIVTEGFNKSKFYKAFTSNPAK